jgi:hypothetical protein
VSPAGAGACKRFRCTARQDDFQEAFSIVDGGEGSMERFERAGSPRQAVGDEEAEVEER